MKGIRDYHNWPSRLEGIGQLHLDPHNPRLARRNHHYTESEIAEELLANSDVQQTALSITNEGYIPLEQLVGFIDDRTKVKYIVEGNRRLLACRLIKDPNKAPSAYRPYYKRLHKRADLKQITRLRVLWAPSREDAWRLIARKHIIRTVKDWKPIMQANFYLQPLEAGYSIEEASEILGVGEAEIRNAKFATQLYTAALELEMAEDMKKLVTNPYDFNLSTLMRVVDVKEGKRYLGVDADEEGNAILKTSKVQFRKRFHRLLRDISVGEESSRTLNKKQDIVDYIANRTGMSASAPSDSNGGQLLISPINKDETTESPESDTPKAQKKKRAVVPRTKPIGLFLPGSIILKHNHPRLKKIMEELESLSPSTHPNACALLLRTFLELSTYLFLRDLQELEIMKNQQNKNGSAHWIPDFRPMLDWIVKKNLIGDGQIIKSLRLYLNDAQYKPWLAQLNQFVHNHAHAPTEARVREIWEDFIYFAEAVNNR